MLLVGDTARDHCAELYLVVVNPLEGHLVQGQSAQARRALEVNPPGDDSLICNPLLVNVLVINPPASVPQISSDRSADAPA